MISLGGYLSMPKKEANDNINFEESIKNYGSKIEHIESFVEAVRRFPGKYYPLHHRYTAGLDRNVMKIILS